MTFPNTHLTLIRRIAEHGSEADWRQFIGDYWRPIRRFAIRHGRVQSADADDIAGSTFEVLIRNRLLQRWSETQSARLRTLLCSVARRQLANRRRKKENQQRQIFSDAGEDTVTMPEVPAAEREVFESLWIDEVLIRALNSLRDSCIREGKIGTFRVLFGRVCEGMTHAEVAHYLQKPLTTVESWYQDARDRLAETLRQQVTEIVRQYEVAENHAGAVEREWDELAEHLKNHGGLESAIRRSHAALSEPTGDEDQTISIARLESLLTLKDAVSHGS